MHLCCCNGHLHIFTYCRRKYCLLKVMHCNDNMLKQNNYFLQARSYKSNARWLWIWAFTFLWWLTWKILLTCCELFVLANLLSADFSVCAGTGDVREYTSNLNCRRCIHFKYCITLHKTWQRMHWIEANIFENEATYQRQQYTQLPKGWTF